MAKGLRRHSLVALSKHLLKRILTRRTLIWTGSLLTLGYIAKKGYGLYHKYAIKVEGLRRLKKNFVKTGQIVKGIGWIDSYLHEYNRPLTTLEPEDHDELNRLLALCNQFGIAVGFWDKPPVLMKEHELIMEQNAKLSLPTTASNDIELLPKLSQPLDRPFVMVSLNKLNRLVDRVNTRQRQAREPSKQASVPL